MKRFLATAINSTKGLPDSVQIPAKVVSSGFQKEVLPKSQIPDITIEEWKPVVQLIEYGKGFKSQLNHASNGPSV